MPSAVISYSWDSEAHKGWVRRLAAQLRRDGIDVKLDQWHVMPGDQLPRFMEQAINGSDFVLIVCTPRYKERSDCREGGVGYEGDIITGAILTTKNQRKFIPLLRTGTWLSAAPAWLAGKLYLDFRGGSYSAASYQELIGTLCGTRPQAPPLGPVVTAPAGGQASRNRPLLSRKVMPVFSGPSRQPAPKRISMEDLLRQLTPTPRPEPTTSLRDLEGRDRKPAQQESLWAPLAAIWAKRDVQARRALAEANQRTKGHDSNVWETNARLQEELQAELLKQ